MKMIFKNFAYVLKKFKTSSLLNILGLSTAFAVFLALMTQVHYDLSHNRSIKDADHIQLLTVYSPFRDVHMTSFPTQLGDEIVSKIPLVEAYTTMANMRSYRFYNKDTGAETAIEERQYKLRGDYTSVFQLNVLEGDMKEAIAEGGNVALSQSVAKKLFANESALGKTIISYYDHEPYTVKAVVEDFAKNCTFGNGVFMYLKEDQPNMSNYNIFMRVKPENRKQLNDYLKSDDFLGKEHAQYMRENPDRLEIASAVPFTDFHLHFPMMGGGDWNVTMALMGIAILTLAIAYINFVNFSIAMAPSRVKALTMQRVLGINRNTQMILIATESAIFSFLAFATALLLVNFLASSPLAELFAVDLHNVTEPSMMLISALTTLIIGFIVGIYPARYINNFDVVESLKGTSTANTKSTSKLRSALIAFQFIATFIPIIVAVNIKLQHDYMVNYSWGIEKESILYIDFDNTDINGKALAADLMKDPRFKDHTFGQFAPGNINMGWGRAFEDKQIYVKSWPVADNYLDFFGATVIAGDNFTKTKNTEKNKIIFNEEFLRRYEFNPEQVISKELFLFEGNGEVIGIVKDINFETLKMPIQPMVFVTLGDEFNKLLFVKLTGNDTQGATKLIEETWAKHSKESLKLRFLDAELDSLYRTENNLGKLVGLFSLITIIIAMMGVYGMITFNIKYRRKEIAIRKINGANEYQILSLVNKTLLIQLIIGFAIASPLAYLIVDKWLSNFAYRMDMQWWVFPAAAVFVLLIALVAVSWQSYRAAISNPVKSLKSE